MSISIIGMFSPFTWEGILTAIFCGIVVGLERQLSGKPAGIRTSILICLGTYTFVALSTIIEGGTTDASRVLGQVITGIGFLGAGLMLTRGGLLVGVTSAAVIWVLASIGALIGFEKYLAAIVLSVLVVSVLSIIGFVEHQFKKLQRGVHKGNHGE